MSRESNTRIQHDRTGLEIVVEQVLTYASCFSRPVAFWTDVCRFPGAWFLIRGSGAESRAWPPRPPAFAPQKPPSFVITWFRLTPY